MTDKKIVFFIFLFIIIFSLIIFMNKDNEKQAKVCFKDNCFEAEIAKTIKEKKTGLMFRKELDLDKGMFFVYDKQDIYSFWMKNVLIPLDIIWINENKEIVFIKENALPCKEKSCFFIKPDKQAKYILEINSGISKKIGLKIGDKLDINF